VTEWLDRRRPDLRPIGLRLGRNVAGQRFEHVGRLVDLAA
jgi:hypothetical protein